MSEAHFLEKLLEGAEVEWMPLGAVIKMERGRQLNKKLLFENGLYPTYNGGISPSGYSDNYNYSEDTIIISQGGASAGFVNFVKSKFYASSHCYVVLPNTELVQNRYVYHFLKLNQKNLMNKQYGAGIPALRASGILNLTVPIPCPDDEEKSLAIQAEIVRILDAFTSLTAELTARKKQYNYYRDQLLTFSDDVVTWKPLGDIILPTRNIRWKDTDRSYRYIDLTSVSRENNSIIETSEITVENAPSRAQKLVERDDVIFATTRPTQLRLCLIDEDYSGEVASTGYCVLRANKSKVLPKWIYYHLSSTDFFNYVEENQSGSAYPAISDSKVKDFEIPIPYANDPEKSLAEQARIVDILDKFDALTNSISEGLPHEIELRQKQYEYYRDLLLNFPKSKEVIS